MRLYLAVSAARPIPPGVAEPRRPDLVMSPDSGPWRAARWTSRDGRTRLSAWSNEPDDPRLEPPLREEGEVALGVPGYLGGPDDAGQLLRAPDLGATVDQLSGVFAAFRADRDGFEAITTAIRLHSVYHATAGDLVIAGNSALLVRDAASETDRVRYDLRALQSLVRSGYFLGDGSPFEGVTALPAHSSLVARAGQARIATRPLPAAEDRVPDRRQRAVLIRDLVDSLKATVAPLLPFSGEIALSLSGGRDSRLVAAALHAAGVPFRASTSGLDGHPDVVLAGRVARLLGVDHAVSAPQRDESGALVVKHPLLRAWEIIRSTEGLISAHNNFPRLAPFRIAPRVSGAGGEQLRGGFLANQAIAAPPAIRQRVQRLFLGSADLLTSQANEWARTDLEPWAEHARRDPMDALDRIYLYYRSGRWSAAARAAGTVGHSTFNLLFDNKLTRAALAMPARWRMSERPLHEAISRLAPPLRDVPLTGKRWRYELSPVPGALRPGWWARAPLRVGQSGAGFDWRNQPDAALLAIFREQILDGPPALFELVERARFEALLARPLKKGGAVLMWNAFTASVLLSGLWMEERPALPDLVVKIPGR